VPRFRAVKRRTTIVASSGRRIGLNVSSEYYGNLNAVSNDLFHGGSTWEYVNGTGAHDLPSANLDANRYPKSMPGGDYSGTTKIRKALNAVRTAGQLYRVSWSGNMASLSSLNGSISSFNNTTKTAILTPTFSQVDGTFPPTIDYTFSSADATNSTYPTNIQVLPWDGSNADTSLLDSKFIADVAALTVSGGPIRVMKLTGVEGNDNNVTAWGGGTSASPTALTNPNSLSSGEWAPNDGALNGGSATDGAPIQFLVAMCNLLNRDLWDTVPWNLSNANMDARFAYVRDNLNAGLNYYCEVSNEVWNGFTNSDGTHSSGYKVHTQAANEGFSRGLVDIETLTTPTTRNGYSAPRHVQKTIEVMDRAAAVFALNMSKLVRVFAMQNAAGGYWAAKYLDYAPSGSTALKNHIDLLSSAPYFEQGTYGPDDFVANSYTGAAQTVFDHGHASIDQVLGWAAEIKAAATARGLQYGCYEAGQSFFFNDAAYRDSIQTDGRMYTLYNYYLTQIASQLGNVPVCMFVNCQGPNNAFGSWGMVAPYSGRTISLANTPKAKAVADYLVS
jgi:hypothetical protein